MQEDLERVLFDEATILRRLDEIAAQISADYRDRELTVIAVLNGSLIFMADLLRRIPLPLKLDCLSVASYHGGTQTSGEMVFKQIALPDVAGRHILILDDILDSGVTLAAIAEKLRSCPAAQRENLRPPAEGKDASAPGGSRLCRLRHRRRIRRWLRARLPRTLSQFALRRRSPETIDRFRLTMPNEQSRCVFRALLLPIERDRWRLRGRSRAPDVGAGRRFARANLSTTSRAGEMGPASSHRRGPRVRGARSSFFSPTRKSPSCRRCKAAEDAPKELSLATREGSRMGRDRCRLRAEWPRRSDHSRARWLFRPRPGSERDHRRRRALGRR